MKRQLLPLALAALLPATARAAEAPAAEAPPATEGGKKMATLGGGEPKESTGLVVALFGGPKSFYAPDATGFGGGGALRVVSHGSTLRSDYGLRFGGSTVSGEVNGFDVSDGAMQFVMDANWGVGFGPIVFVLGVGLGAASVSSELQGLGKTFSSDPGFTLLGEFGGGLSFEADQLVQGFRPALRVKYESDLFGDEEAVGSGDATGILIALELGWEVTSW